MNALQHVEAVAHRLRRGEARVDVVVIGALLTLAIFVVDLFLPLGIAGGVPYIAPVFLAMWLPDRRLIVAVAAVCSVLTVADVGLSPGEAPMAIVIANRIMALVAIWTVAVLSLQRKGFEGALARSEAAHRAVLATTADGILTLDERGDIASVNPAAARIFGYTAAELLGRPFTDVLAPEHRARFERGRAALRQPAGDGERSVEEDPALAHEAAGLHRSGAVLPLEVVLVPLLHDEGPQYTVTVRDITARRLLEQHLLRASDAERRALGYSLHEELGQSLTGLRLISRQLARRLEGRELDEAAEVAELAALLHEVDQQALDLFRTIAPLDAEGRLADALAELVASTARRHSVRLEEAPALDGLEGPADGFYAAQLYQLTRDLLNALLDGRGGERLAVEAGRSGEACWLRLRLAGPDGSGGRWTARVRPLAYRAKLIDVGLEFAEAAGEGGVVVCRWSCARPAGGDGAAVAHGVASTATG